jgi:hypothetical protein
VARDPEDSGLGTSALATSSGARGTREVASCEGSHGDRTEDDTWHRASVFGELEGERTTTFHLPFPDREIPDKVESLTVDFGDRGSEFQSACGVRTRLTIREARIPESQKGIRERYPVGEEDSREELEER